MNVARLRPFCLVVLALALAVPASAADYRIQLNFYTPGAAVMCWEDHHEVQLECFTPNDRFSIFMYPTGRVPRDGDEHPYSGASVKNPTYKRWSGSNFNTKTGGLLNFGYRWTEWQALKPNYTCLSQKTGLTHAKTAPAMAGGSAATRATECSECVRPKFRVAFAVSSVAPEPAKPVRLAHWNLEKGSNYAS